MPVSDGRARLKPAFPTTALAVGLHGPYDLFSIVLAETGFSFWQLAQAKFVSVSKSILV
jgi:hypothetical protein